MDGDPTRRRFVDEMLVLWETAGRPEDDDRPSDSVVESDLEALRRRMERGPARRPDPDRHVVRSRDRGRGSRFLLRRLAGAAVIAISVVGGAFLFGRGVQNGGTVDAVEPAVREIATERGQRARVTLEDGTEVRLNVESRISFPEEFADDRREVSLSGEAYFEVAPDLDVPFLVRAGNAEVQVVGTAFNVNSYETDQMVQVVVSEGGVRLAARDTTAATSILLTPHQMGRVINGQPVRVRGHVDLSQQLAWLEGALWFSDTPLREVAAALERHYDLDVQVEDVKIAERRLTARFADESVPVILRVIATSLDIQYTIDPEHRLVRFHR